MRLLYVANGFPPTALGGVETHTYEVARDMVRRGHKVWVFCRESAFDRPDGEVLEEDVNGIRVIRIVNDFKGIIKFHETYLNESIEDNFDSILTCIRPDIVHIHHLIGLSVGLPIRAHRRQIPVIMTLHDFWPLCHRVHLLDRWERLCPGPRRGGDCPRCVAGDRPSQALIAALRRWKPWLPLRIQRWLQRRTGGAGIPLWADANQDAFQQRFQLFQKALDSCDLLLAPSAFVRQVFIENSLTRSEIRILPPGIDYPKNIGYPPGSRGADADLRLGYIGWFQPLKGVHLLIRAFRRLPHPHLSLHLFGPFDERHPYCRLLLDLIGGDPRIRIHGPFLPNERPHVYRSLDLLVIPSMGPETFSKVAREALAYGVPVVASRVGALPEAVCDGVNGFLVDPGDEEALYQILRQVAERPELLRSLSIPGPLSLLSIEDHTEALMQIYREVLA